MNLSLMTINFNIFKEDKVVVNGRLGRVVFDNGHFKILKKHTFFNEK